MNTLSEFLFMGGYGGFVWPAYAIALLVLASLVVTSLKSLRAAEAEVAALEAASLRRRGATDGDGGATP